MDKELLARRQKDLNGFVERYDDRLEKMLGKHIDNLAPAWQGLTKTMTGRLKDLYAEIGATEDPKKLKALKNKAKRMEALASQLSNDLNTMQAKLQPYYTGALSHIYEDSYYMHAYGLEQAAGVAVRTPILTPMNVLGVIANPWLPDAATYSDRIRANTAYLAQKMRGVVANAVARGQGINEAARALGDAAGEGYFNSVRLMRTELNRASSLGSSYLYMQNADILDGKRWNATLDSKVAPKDAENDGAIFDLDYDTPENSGIPGKRIPNHPNCRCKYSPVLSSTGVSEQERIARTGDSVDSWGKRTHVKAKDYREYADKVGLPNLDDRLDADNLKSYLRPGEPLSALNERVVRWKVPGAGTITVAKPFWELAQVITPPIPGFTPAATVEEAAKAAKVAKVVKHRTWADDVKDRIAKGVSTEADVREVGTLVRKQVDDFEQALVLRKQAANKLQVELIDQLNAMDPSTYDGPLYAELTEKMKVAGQEYWNVTEMLVHKKADRMRDIIKEIRPVGPKSAKDLQEFVKGSSVDVKASVEDVRGYLPQDWLQASNTRPLKAKKSKRGYYREAPFKDEADLINKGYTMDHLKAAGKLEYMEDHISLSGEAGTSMTRCTFHEMGHRMEDMVPGIKKLEQEFYARRTAGEQLEWLGPGYKMSEATRKDKFLSSYMGKDYGNKEDSFYELLSMGLESAYKGSYDLAKDEDFADFIYGLIAAL